MAVTTNRSVRDFPASQRATGAGHEPRTKRTPSRAPKRTRVPVAEAAISEGSRTARIRASRSRIAAGSARAMSSPIAVGVGRALDRTWRKRGQCRCGTRERQGIVRGRKARAMAQPNSGARARTRGLRRRGGVGRHSAAAARASIRAIAPCVVAQRRPLADARDDMDSERDRDEHKRRANTRPIPRCVARPWSRLTREAGDRSPTRKQPERPRAISWRSANKWNAGSRCHRSGAASSQGASTRICAGTVSSRRACASAMASSAGSAPSGAGPWTGNALPSRRRTKPEPSSPAHQRQPGAVNGASSGSAMIRAISLRAFAMSASSEFATTMTRTCRRTLAATRQDGARAIVVRRVDLPARRRRLRRRGLRAAAAI